MPSVLEELLDLFAKDVKDVLKKNVWLWLAMLQLFHQKFLQVSMIFDKAATNSMKQVFAFTLRIGGAFFLRNGAKDY